MRAVKRQCAEFASISSTCRRMPSFAVARRALQFVSSALQSRERDGRTIPRRTATADTAGDRLDSWKEIAAYLNRDVTTVQRWEKREGMPVHRHQHDRMGSVYAFRAELDAWVRSRHLRRTAEGETSAAPAPEPSSGDRRPRLAEPDRSSSWHVAAAGAVLAIGAGMWLRATEFFWRSPIADAQFQRVTDFDGVEQAAAVSRDGRFVAFLSDRDGQMDVWVTQVGSGQFHNLTRGSAAELVNPSVRLLGFSPDGSLVTFWVRRPDGSRAERSASGQSPRSGASRGRILKASPSPIGPPTARDSCTTRPDPAIRCS